MNGRKGVLIRGVPLYYTPLYCNTRSTWKLWLRLHSRNHKRLLCCVVVVVVAVVVVVFMQEPCMVIPLSYFTNAVQKTFHGISLWY